MYMKSVRNVNDPIVLAYSGQDGGATLPYFVGRQHGAGWLRTLARIAFPIVRKVLGMAGNVAMNTAGDLIANRKSFKDSVKDNAMNEATNVLVRSGGGVKRKKSTPSSSSSINKRRNKHLTIFDRK